ncbi:hypothetical protein IWQ49_005738 [Labrenzia sp. EL_126]|nr:hypothetical protein [Labrenzia sp. EL_126]
MNYYCSCVLSLVAALLPVQSAAQSGFDIECSCLISVVCGADACSTLSKDACEKIALKIREQDGETEVCMRDGCTSSNLQSVESTLANDERLRVLSGELERINEPGVNPYYAVATLSFSWETAVLSLYGEDGPIHTTLTCKMP